MPGVPGAHIANNRGGCYARFFAWFTQSGLSGSFTFLDCPFDQLYACNWMAEQQDVRARNTGEDDGASHVR